MRILIVDHSPVPRLHLELQLNAAGSPVGRVSRGRCAYLMARGEFWRWTCR
jgi:hypothetical protein